MISIALPVWQLPHSRRWIALGLLLGAWAVAGGLPAEKQAGGAEPSDYFGIRVVDQETGRGVPLVELKTVHGVRYYTDSAGWVAFLEPGLMNQGVFFSVRSHGYEFAKDGFGFRGARLTTTPGHTKTLKVRRINLAERLYRVTGAGIYRDSVLLGKPTPLRQPLLNAQVLGSDSVVNAVFRGRIYWFWGDTNRPSYPLGNFHVPGATSELPTKGGLDPQIGVNLRYFAPTSGVFAQPTAKMPGKGPTWIGGLFPLTDPDGTPRLFASYVKIKPPLKVYARGLVEFDDQKKRFAQRAEFALDAPLFPHGHPLQHRDGGRDYIYFGDPFPLVRVPARIDALSDPAKYEAYTCLKPGSRDDKTVEQTAGKAVFAWKRDTLPYTQGLERRLLERGALAEDQRLFRLKHAGGKPIRIHRGSVSWNDYRQRWIMIGVEQFGRSFLGEVWCAEAKQLVGPWTKPKRIVSHDKYSFYNPKQHPMFAQQGGRIIYFEGTYTNTFSGNPDQTPRYNYNQIMYRLDLARLGAGS